MKTTNLVVASLFCFFHILAIPAAAYLLRRHSILLSVTVLAICAGLSLWVSLFKAAYKEYINSRPK